MTGAYKRTALLLSLFVLSLNAFAQFRTPIRWSYETKDAGNLEVLLLIKAELDSGYHIYAQTQKGEPEIMPVSFEFDTSAAFELLGKVQEPKAKIVMDGLEEVALFEKSVVFTQRIKIKSRTPFKVHLAVYGSVCAESGCVPFNPQPEYTFNIVPALLEEPDQSFWTIFLIGFLGGFAALLTPCVFPMIPLTVSFFTKRSKTRAKGIANAITYGLAIILIYVSLGLAVTMIFGPDALHAFSTNVWFNLAMFLLLVVFAASFLGAFEIVLPSAFVNKVDAQSDRGGLIGILFMAFTLSLVSFSCTSGIIGPLLVEAAVHGGIKGPFWGMLGFAFALALPFGVFAAFPGWLNSLPKSGGWLNSVKVVLGFIELALALKFASNADLVVQAWILTKEVFLVIWMAISLLLTFYLLGWIRFSHDSEVKHLSVTRTFFATLTLAFTFYLLTGLMGNNLKLISGFPPPDFYTNMKKDCPPGPGGDPPGPKPKERSMHCPNDLPCYHDYDEALAAAKESGKPLMIDFTGWACVSCRSMEQNVWTDPEVDKRLRNEVVLVSLYVDDANELPKEEQGVKKLGTIDFTVETIGQKWAYLQAVKYNTNAQPQYVLLDHKEEILVPPTNYDPSVPKYLEWLDKGIAEFKARKAQ